MESNWSIHNIEIGKGHVLQTRKGKISITLFNLLNDIEFQPKFT